MIKYVPWTARRSKQSILKEISSEYSSEVLMLKWNSNTLATWCEELTYGKRSWCWERLKAGREEDRRGCDIWKGSLIWWAWVWASFGSWWWTGKPGVHSPWSFKESDMTQQWTNWTWFSIVSFSNSLI